MQSLEQHPYFTKYVDAKSGVVSYILTKKLGQVQQHFYFSQPSITEDGRYMWIRVANPPMPTFTYALVSLDSENPFIRHFPQAGGVGLGNCPVITPEQDGLYFALDDCIYKVDMVGNVTKVVQLDPDFVKYRYCERLFTHGSVSCDNKYIALDMHISDKYYVGIGNIKTGEVKILNNFGRCYNHALFSPTKPDIMLIDQDWWREAHTGEYFPIDNRMWLIGIEGNYFEPVIPKMFYGRDGTEIAHDFWSDDGKLCWIDYAKGAYECDIDTKEICHVWKRPICHSHASSDRSMWCGDQSPYAWQTEPCKVLFYDRKTDKEIEIFSALPAPKAERKYYHNDPHPQFAAKDRYIVSTTTVYDGAVDIAITPVEPLLEQCRNNGKEVGDKQGN